MKFFAKLSPNESVFGLIYYLLQLLIVPGIIVAVNLMLPVSMSEAMINFLFFAVNFVAVLVIFRKFLTTNLRQALEAPWYVLRCAGLGFLLYMVGNGLFSLLITWVAPDFTNINDASIMGMVQEHFGLMTVGTVLLVPVAEECFYRGLIFRSIYERSPFWGYLVSMVVFSLAHVLGYVIIADLKTLVLCFFQYLPAGFALAWSYRHSGSIFASILIHMTVNQVGMLYMR